MFGKRLRFVRKLLRIVVAQRLLMFDELLGGIGGHEERGDDADGDGLALDTRRFQVLRHRLRT